MDILEYMYVILTVPGNGVNIKPVMFIRNNKCSWLSTLDKFINGSYL